MDIPSNYDSFISVVTEKLSRNISETIDDGVYKAVLNYGINIDKKKLFQALLHDKKRYTEAYRKGFIAAVTPRVMSEEEARKAEVVFVEMISNEGELLMLEPVIKYEVNGKTYNLCSEFNKGQEELPLFLSEEYGVCCRCWTARPSEERRKSTPWKGKEE